MPLNLFVTRRLCFAVTAFTLLQPVATRAADFEPLTLLQQFDLRGGVASQSPTPLVPAPRSLGYQDVGVRGSWLLGARVDADPLQIFYQGRTVLGRLAGRDPVGAEIGQSPPLRYETDEAYLRWRPDERFVFNIGRRNLVFGRAVGLNPVDFLARPLEQDSSLDAVRARSEQQGFDMVGFEWHADAGTMQVHHLPQFSEVGRGEPSQTIAAWSGLAFAGSLDYALFARHRAQYGDPRERFGSGMSISGGLDDATVAYIDLRIDDDRGRVVPNTGPGTRPQPFTEIDQRLYPIFTIGISHTFASDISVDLEYTHDSTGYSASEWREVASAIDRSSPPISPMDFRDIGAINRALQGRTLRRNYAFKRLTATHPEFSSVTMEATALVGLDDFSGVLGFGVTYRLIESTSAGIRVQTRFGNHSDEFRLRPDQHRLTLSLTARF
jgi:hypothetical protein